jgi:hypothetical protein
MQGAADFEIKFLIYLVNISLHYFNLSRTNDSYVNMNSLTLGSILGHWHCVKLRCVGSISDEHAD